MLCLNCRPRKKYIFHVLYIVLGWFLASVTILHPSCSNSEFYSLQSNSGSRSPFFVVGVLTAEGFLRSRALAIYETYAATLRHELGEVGKIIFFTSEMSNVSGLPNGMNVVRLPRVDDSYPPQEKSFTMLQYLWGRYHEGTEWFVRLDDDVYLRPRALLDFVRSLNSSRPLLIGQTGFGRKEEQLELGFNSNYCMGGPGMIISRRLLESVAPKFRNCLKTVVTSHEDVEVSRCFSKFGSINCTWAHQMRSLMVHSQNPAKLLKNLKRKSLDHVITIHPLKSVDEVYQVHEFENQMRRQNLEDEVFEVQRELSRVESLLTVDDSWDTDGASSLNDDVFPEFAVMPVETSVGDVIPYDFLLSQTVFHGTGLSSYIRGTWLKLIHDLVDDLMEEFRNTRQQKGRSISFKKFLSAYSRLVPGEGLHVLLDLLVQYTKFRGPKQFQMKAFRYSKLLRPFTALKTAVAVGNNEEPKVTLVVPVSGRVHALSRFLNSVGGSCGGKHQCRMVVVLTPSEDEREQRALLEDFINENGRQIEVDILTSTSRTFVRGISLEEGIKQACQPEDLLFLVDVDVVFTSEALSRVKALVVRGEQAYFPMVFSEYESSAAINEAERFVLDRHRGFWRNFGFGTVGIYASDFLRSGGFDESIDGWGAEDVRFANRLLSLPIRVFRAPDPGVVHVYHPPGCLSLTTGSRDRRNMCLFSSYRVMGSIEELAQVVLKNDAFSGI